MICSRFYSIPSLVIGYNLHLCASVRCCKYDTGLTEWAAVWDGHRENPGAEAQQCPGTEEERWLTGATGGGWMRTKDLRFRKTFQKAQFCGQTVRMTLCTSHSNAERDVRGGCLWIWGTNVCLYKPLHVLECSSFASAHFHDLISKEGGRWQPAFPGGLS